MANILRITEDKYICKKLFLLNLISNIAKNHSMRIVNGDIDTFLIVNGDPY